MREDLQPLERDILKVLQTGMPSSLTPYRDMAERIGIDTEQLLAILRKWKEDGKIRRTGAIVNHFRLGRGAGAMVVWTVPEGKADEIGGLFASFAAVSHAYLRETNEMWRYNVYTMVHASSEDELEETIREMSSKSGIEDYRVLKTVRELKKVPPTYI